MAETGKQRAARIPLDYYKQPDRLEKGKRRLLLAGLIVPLALTLLWWLRGSAGKRPFSRGPVAAVHAAWNDNCTACHEPFKPISSDNLLAGWLPQHVADNRHCQTCHAGPPHHAHQKPDLVCSHCHREHRGSDASLVRLDDRACVQCHADLAAHVLSGQATYHTKVSGFHTDHPPFRQPEDLGRLKFNHQRHLSAGMKLPGGGEVFTIDKLAAADRERYSTGQAANQPVQLTCASCHQLEGEAGAAPGDGAYMRPVSYEQHCKACHPLTLPVNRAGTVVDVPHHLQPDQLRRFLWGVFAEIKAGKNPEPILPQKPFPGETAEQAQKRQKVAGEVVKAERFLYLGRTACGECHYYEPQAGSVRPKGIKPPQVSEFWFGHAKFAHSAHRAVNCVECHREAQTSAKNQDVLLPSIEDCRRCHTPGRARSDCTECHRYHHGDGRQRGIGARERGVKEKDRLTVPDFLSGGTRKD